MKRMNREEFFSKLATLDGEQLQKALWNLYWRGSAVMRERIEAELAPEQHKVRQRPAAQSVDPELLLHEVRDFVALVRSGAYLGGDRRVSPRERTRWRFTFQRLATEAQGALAVTDISAGAAAMEQLIELACELRSYDYFRSEDPVEAARFVVSDAVALSWGRLRDSYGFAGFAERAAPQLIRWESRYGWTRGGWGRIPDKETSLASVLTRLLRAPDTWVGFADHYLDALDHVAVGGEAGPRRSRGDTDFERGQRTAELAEWHLLLLDRLADYEAGDRLDRLAGHPALGGPELTFFQGRLAYQRGDASRAHDLVHESLTKLPGHPAFQQFATEIGTPLPPHAQEIAEQRQRGSRVLP